MERGRMTEKQFRIKWIGDVEFKGWINDDMCRLLMRKIE